MVTLCQGHSCLMPACRSAVYTLNSMDKSDSIHPDTFDLFVRLFKFNRVDESLQS